MEFKDDGGTPMWRARQAGYRTIDVGGGRKRLSFAQWVMVIVFFGVLPYAILFGGIICLAIFDAITR